MVFPLKEFQAFYDMRASQSIILLAVITLSLVWEVFTGRVDYPLLILVIST